VVEAKLKSYSEINLIETTVPGDSDTGFSALEAAFTGGASNSASIVVRLDDSVDLNAEQKKLSDGLASLQIDSWQIQVAQESMTGSGSISVVVSGTNPADVQNATAAVIAALSNKNDFPDLLNVKSDLATTASEVEIDVDPNKAILDGTTTVGVQGEVQNALTGTKAGTVSLAGVPADVYLQLNAQLDSLPALQQLPVGVADMPLGQIATVSEQATQAVSAASISRLPPRSAPTRQARTPAASRPRSRRRSTTSRPPASSPA